MGENLIILITYIGILFFGDDDHRCHGFLGVSLSLRGFVPLSYGPAMPYKRCQLSLLKSEMGITKIGLQIICWLVNGATRLFKKYC